MSIGSYVAKLIISMLIPFFYLLMQLSFVIKINKIIANYNREKYSIVPFLVNSVNCFTWLLYGITRKEHAVTISNFIGLVIGFVGTLVYHRYSIYPPLLFYYVVTFGLLFISLLIFVLNWIDCLGMVGMCLAMLLYLSPLATVNIVLLERSTESMSFPLTITGWLSATLWLVYAVYVANDLWIAIPSVLGIIFTSIQLFLFFLFGLNPEETFASEMHHLYRFDKLIYFRLFYSHFLLLVPSLLLQNLLSFAELAPHLVLPQQKEKESLFSIQNHFILCQFIISRKLRKWKVLLRKSLWPGLLLSRLQWRKHPLQLLGRDRHALQRNNNLLKDFFNYLTFFYVLAIQFLTKQIILMSKDFSFNLKPVASPASSIHWAASVC
jgi:uncharacterized protein with PQ loop repeat